MTLSSLSLAVVVAVAIVFMTCSVALLLLRQQDLVEVREHVHSDRRQPSARPSGAGIREGSIGDGARRRRLDIVFGMPILLLGSFLKVGVTCSDR
jgi:hypothetical protein